MPLLLSRDTFRHSFTLDLQFLYGLKRRVRLSKTVCVRFSIFIPVSFLLKFYIFVQQNA